MTVCLSMIVKNEAHCISKCLESVKPFIDYWVICDTGSTDNTEEIIKTTLADVPGELYKHEWQDFSTNRNKALELARSKADYVLIIDADDYLVAEASTFDNLNEAAYRIMIHHGSIHYPRTQLVKSNVACQYIGVLHEYLKLPVDAVLLEGCHIVYGANGARSQSPNKYLHDAEIFEKELAKDPTNTRNVFYCAQSYRDANVLDKALEYYIKRSRMGGWQEEVYVSLLEAAKLMERLQYDLVESYYLRAFNYYPIRAEALFYLCVYCRAKKYYDKLVFYSNVWKTIKQPVEGLFLEPRCYWRPIAQRQ